MKDKAAPLFETYADATIDRVRATYAHRGTEYGDSWRNAQWLNMKAVCKQLGINIPVEYLRVLAIAGLCDVKYNRLEGGYKDDTIVDSIAYYSLLAEEMRILESMRLIERKCVMQRPASGTYEQDFFIGGGNMPTNGAAKATPELGAASNGRAHL